MNNFDHISFLHMANRCVSRDQHMRSRAVCSATHGQWFHAKCDSEAPCGAAPPQQIILNRIKSLKIISYASFSILKINRIYVVWTISLFLLFASAQKLTKFTPQVYSHLLIYEPFPAADCGQLFRWPEAPFGRPRRAATPTISENRPSFQAMVVQWAQWAQWALHVDPWDPLGPSESDVKCM